MLYLTCHLCGNWLEHEQFSDDPTLMPVCNACFIEAVDNYCASPQPESRAASGGHTP